MLPGPFSEEGIRGDPALGLSDENPADPTVRAHGDAPAHPILTVRRVPHGLAIPLTRRCSVPASRRSEPARVGTCACHSPHICRLVHLGDAAAQLMRDNRLSLATNSE